ncbi:MAG TPA: hypothetical protein VG457_06200, partial [Planctomycetota bacterium]|nr:hypothetical protein [Planctomycetota bacterium]
LRREPDNLLWACNLGTLAVGMGLLFGSPTWNAIGTYWLVPGLPLWIYDLAKGGEFLWTSVLTHVGGLGVGFFGLRRLGVPRGGWWKATAALGALVAVCRVATPPKQNINLAHAPYPGWETTFPSHLAYLGALFALFTLVWASLQFGLPRLGFRGAP